uniref:Uncharacterized protein n=1 Tax=Anopheles dirus TaxID=7168 RepID=A0A182N9I8_9DIPT
MKLFTLLVSLELICLAYSKHPSAGDRKLVSYESKINHKIPDKTIAEEKIEDPKKSQSIEESDVTDTDESSIPNYEFGYGVKDPITGDHKDQWEKRHGDHVKGGYRFDESDGTQRVVEYESSGKKGFEATVKNVERKEAAAGDEEGTAVEAKKGGVAHSYSYLKRTGH